MSYLVLARKWRPKTFSEVAGQEHVLRALINALDSDRLHHAFLFSGTRGVGKTTLARIFAKSINCERGVSSTPCGECTACVEIDQGRFVDLLEVDAASRTRVDDTRELLDNVQYSPTRGRYKVYLIDEVHMLSTHSFNALLKTLEEPPPHVKFLLATTDPQKLPVTVLSRCLQFNLKRLAPGLIQAQLARIAAAEGYACEAGAVALLATAADGSMRDALSLLDQAIAHSNGQLTRDAVADMLGTVDRTQVVRLMQALIHDDGGALLAIAAALGERGIDGEVVLSELAALCQQVALAQVVPEALEERVDDAPTVASLAAASAPETVQLWYQIALVSRRDLPLAPSPQVGLEMALLRMLAFRPGPGADDAAAGAGGGASAATPTGQAASMPAPGAATVGAGSSGAGSSGAGSSDARSSGASSSGAASVAPASAAPSSSRSASGAEASPTGPTGGRAAADGRGFRDVARDLLGSDLASSSPRSGRAATAPPAAGRRGSGPLAAGVGGAGPAVATPSEGAEAASPPAPGHPPAGGARVAAAAPEGGPAFDWEDFVASLGANGMLRQLADNCLVQAVEHNVLRLQLDAEREHLSTRQQCEALGQALRERYGEHWSLRICVGELHGQSAARRAEAERQARRERAIRALREDPFVQALEATFDARLLEDTVQPHEVPASDRAQAGRERDGGRIARATADTTTPSATSIAPPGAPGPDTHRRHEAAATQSVHR